MSRFNNSKRCLKCGGNIFINQDLDGWYEQCLQCGFTCDLRVVYEDKGKPVFAPLEKIELNITDN
jgi:hypothetical protein